MSTPIEKMWSKPFGGILVSTQLKARHLVAVLGDIPLQDFKCRGGLNRGYVCRAHRKQHVDNPARSAADVGDILAADVILGHKRAQNIAENFS